MRQTRRSTRKPTAPTASRAELSAVHEGAAVGDPDAPAPRPVIGDSWDRLRRLGLDPDRGAATIHLGPAEVEHRRHASGLDEVMGVLRGALLDPLAESPLILAIADAEGHVLWHEGERQLRRSADRIGFLIGARWVEENVGTNGIGTALRAERPMQVHSAEHYLRSHHSWTCVAAPVHDPRTGRLAGVINISAPARGAQPYLLQLTTTAARLAEAELRARRLESLHRLRTVATPLLAKVTGPALVVDADGWTAAATGLPPANRLRLPSEGWGSSAVHWLPSLGECAVEPLGEPPVPALRLLGAAGGPGGVGRGEQPGVLLDPGDRATGAPPEPGDAEQGEHRQQDEKSRHHRIRAERRPSVALNGPPSGAVQAVPVRAPGVTALPGTRDTREAPCREIVQSGDLFSKSPQSSYCCRCLSISHIGTGQRAGPPARAAGAGRSARPGAPPPRSPPTLAPWPSRRP